MKENSPAARIRRKFKVTTGSNHQFPVAPNLPGQSFTADHPTRVWASDITHIATGEGWLHLAVIRDLHSRQVVGWSMRERLQRDLVLDAFQQAVMRHRPLPGLIFHSDWGVQYACSDFRELLAEHQAIQSMSGKGTAVTIRSASRFSEP